MSSPSTKNFIDSKGRSLSPSSYKIKEIIFTNHKGLEKDIQNIVVGMSINESLYSPSLQLKIDIKDVNNFFEDFPIIGQEKIRVHIEKVSIDTTQEIDLTFIISSYPLFNRPKSEHMQVYSLTGISPFAYISNLKKISRSFADKTSAVVSKIYKDELNQDLIVTGNVISRAKGIIPVSSPLQACEALRTKTFDDKQSPFYLYQTLSGKTQLTSHYSLNQSDVYETYVDSRDYNQAPQSDNEYRLKARKILDVVSDLKLSKMFQSMDGAFSSSNRYLDIASKTYVKENFTYDEISSNMTRNGKPILSNTFTVQGKPLNELRESHLEHISLNTQAYDSLEQTLNDKRRVAKGKPKAYLENFETFIHDLVLFGDFRLNAGRKITLKFPKACDPSVQKKLLTENADNIFDGHLSGDYIISSVVHSFQDGEYYCNTRVKRDCFSIDL